MALTTDVPAPRRATGRKVVVTGIGPVTPVGTGVEEFWTGLTTGRNGVREIARFATDDLPVKVAGDVHDFDPSLWLDPKEIRRTDRFSHYAIAAGKLAWEDAGTPDVPSERGGIVFGTGIGGIETLLMQHNVLLEKGPGRVSPFMVPALMANAAAGHLAMKFGLTGPNYCTVSACASSNHAIGEGMRLIRDGYLDVCITGGSEAATLPLTVAAFAQMTALTKNPDPESASRPFDAEPQRVRAVGGGGIADPRVRGARAGARRADLLRGRGLRDVRRRPPHHRAGSERLRRGARDAVGARRRRRGAGVGPRT